MVRKHLLKALGWHDAGQRRAARKNALKRIEEAASSRATVLDLSNLHLTTLPPEYPEDTKELLDYLCRQLEEESGESDGG